MIACPNNIPELYIVPWRSRGSPSWSSSPHDASPDSPRFLFLTRINSHQLSISTATAIMSPSHEAAGPSTLSLHADDPANVVTDVAPPLHVSTTFRYPDNPEDLVPVADSENVCQLIYLVLNMGANLCSIMKTIELISTPVFLPLIPPVSNSFFRRCSMAMLSVTRLDCPR